jgi:hypothetical protein
MVGMSEMISMAAPPFFGRPADLNQTRLKVNERPKKDGQPAGQAAIGAGRVFCGRNFTRLLRRNLVCYLIPPGGGASRHAGLP